MLTQCPQKSSFLDTFLLVDTTMPCEMNVVAHYLVPEVSLIYRKTPISCIYMGYVNKFDHNYVSVGRTLRS